ncbi:MAG TPA: sulfurtransferase TusA family protein [Acidimicrobiia bacterium]|nr:sulfurtransferase TusA family protein [Acidimicrobiia bacterium]
MTESITADETLDTSGLVCPLPVYKAALLLNRLEVGRVLQLITTDPGALADIPAMARQRGDELLGTEDSGSVQVFWIRKGGQR